jgi:hypothetical protein
MIFPESGDKTSAEHAISFQCLGSDDIPGHFSCSE